MFRQLCTCFIVSSMLVVAADPSRVTAQVIFGPPTEVEGVNGPAHDDDPTITPDGLTLVFSSVRSGARELWQSTRESLAEPWNSPTNLGPLINGGYSRYPNLSADGLSLYFSDGYLDGGQGSGHGRPRPGGQGGADIWLSTRESIDEPWSEPTNVEINSHRGEDSPVIADDGLTLYFSSNRSGGSGGNDIYVAHRSRIDEPWGEPVNLTSLNSDSDEYMGGISSDGKLLFFDSDRSGGVGAGDVYMAMRSSREEAFGEPVNVGTTINGSNWDFRASPTANDSMLYFAQGGRKRNDLVQVEVQQPADIAVGIDVRGGLYAQDFDQTLGVDGSDTSVRLPAGWAGSSTGQVGVSAITRPFQNGRRTRLTGNSDVLNVGLEQESDRALATGVSRNGAGSELQFHAASQGGDATELRLQFALEAWGTELSTSAAPGEAAFQVVAELDAGQGFETVLNLGTVTTGPNLVVPEDHQINGNENAVAFDSGWRNLSVPNDATLRLRWITDTSATTSGWTFGLDDVRLELGIAGDLDRDGALTATDIDLLSQAITHSSGDPTFDLNRDGVIDSIDYAYWAKQLKQTWLGDADLDGEFDSSDLVEVFQSAKYERDIDANWTEGDWTADGRFDSSDLIAAFQDGGYEVGARAATSAIPEPTCAALLAIGVISVGRLRKRRTT